jgi:hypothetical protein
MSRNIYRGIQLIKLKIINKLFRFNTINLAQSSTENSIERRQYLTEKLKNSIEPVIPLFREILSDFRPFLQKTLLGVFLIN